MSKQPRGLGKGLDALLGPKTDLSNIRKPVEYINKTVVTAEEPKGSAGVMLVPVDMIEPNPFQPRMLFDQGKLEELTESIRSYGLIQPITVRKVSPQRYQIISGERRFRACRLVGMSEVPAYIRDTNDHEMIGMAIVENIQREDLDPIEVALSYQRLIDECNLTQEQMAAKVGKQRASVTNYLRLLRLPDKVQHDLRVGILSVGHAKVLLGIDDSKMQEKLCDLVIKNGLSVRQLEEKIKKMAGGEDDQKKPAQSQELPENYCRVLEIMGRYVSNDISLKRNKTGKGTMTIHFNSDEEVQKFLDAITESKI